MSGALAIEKILDLYSHNRKRCKFILSLVYYKIAIASIRIHTNQRKTSFAQQVSTTKMMEVAWEGQKRVASCYGINFLFRHHDSSWKSKQIHRSVHREKEERETKHPTELAIGTATRFIGGVRSDAVKRNRSRIKLPRRRHQTMNSKHDGEFGNVYGSEFFGVLRS